MTLWGIAVAFFIGILDLGLAATDYLLGSTNSTITFFGYDGITSRFIVAFLCGISSTLIRICESAFAAYKKN